MRTFLFAFILSALVLTGCGVSRLPVVDNTAGKTIVVDKSLDAALAACPATQCNITIPAGTFPTSHYDSACITRSDLTITGAGQPVYDNPNAPTKLVGGTIIQPGLAFCGASNVSVSDLGLDDGPAYVAAGGPVTDGLAFDGANNPAPTDAFWTNNAVERVTSLGSSNNAQTHAFRFEHGDGVYFDKLSATYDTHCLAVKSQHVTGGSIATQACLSDGVVIKSDSYSAVSSVDIAQITVRSLVPNDSNNGLVLDSETGGTNTTSLVRIRSIQTTGAYSGVLFLNNGNGGGVDGIQIDSLDVSATYIGPIPACLSSASSTGRSFLDVTISNINCANNTGKGGFTATKLYSPLNGTINNWTTTGEINPGYFSGNIQISGWNNMGPGSAVPVFYLVGGKTTTLQLTGYTNNVPGAPLYDTDGNGETLEVQ
jgi:hypothetical protein